MKTELKKTLVATLIALAVLTVFVGGIVIVTPRIQQHRKIASERAAAEHKNIAEITSQIEASSKAISKNLKPSGPAHVAGRYTAMDEGEPFLILELFVDGTYALWDSELRKIGTGPYYCLDNLIICDEINGWGKHMKVNYRLSDDETILTCDNDTPGLPSLQFKLTTSFVHFKSIIVR